MYGPTHRNIASPTKHARNASKMQPHQIPSCKEINRCNIDNVPNKCNVSKNPLHIFPMKSMYLIIFRVHFIGVTRIVSLQGVLCECLFVRMDVDLVPCQSQFPLPLPNELTKTLVYG